MLSIHGFPSGFALVGLRRHKASAHHPGPGPVRGLLDRRDQGTTPCPGQSTGLVHTLGRPRVCGVFGDNTRVYAFTPTGNTPTCGLFDSGANLCMTNNPNLLVDVRLCPPFTISLATSDGGHSHTNVCRRRGLLPLPLLDGSTYYQTCFIYPHASETFISPQAIIDSSAGSFDKWQMEGFSQGRHGHLKLFSPLGLLTMSIQLS
jgi:hypothetical protein